MAITPTTAPLLEVEGLATHFATRAGLVRAVDDVSFTVARGEIVGLVGESGSGKSMTGYSIMGLVDPPGRIVAGGIGFDGVELTALRPGEMRRLRGNRIAMIFQDPMMTLNPVLSIRAQMVEAIHAHRRASPEAARDEARDALAKVGIAAPDARLSAYPHQLSGGTRQRVAIAIALLNDPELIIADEPTTALDVTVQGQILFEMQNQVRDSGTALIWITHDLSVDRRARRPRLRDVRGPDRRAGRGGRRARAPATSVHAGTHRLGAGARAARRAAEADSRDAAIGARSAVRLRVPRALRIRERGLRHDARAAADRRPGPRAIGALSSSARTGGRLNALAQDAGSAAAGDLPLVELHGVSKRFVRNQDVAARVAAWLGAGAPAEAVLAVDSVDLAILPGEVMGLVGESGCGKSTLGRIAAGLLQPTSGTQSWQGVPLAGGPSERARMQRLKMQMIFQDPYAALNPRMRVVDIVGEAPVVHGLISATREDRIRRIAPQPRRPRPDADAALSAPVLGRTARAHRHCPRARGFPGIPRLRRIGGGTRRVDPGAGAQPLHGAARAFQPHVSFHQPRPRRRPAHERPRRGDVSRPDRRIRPGRRDLRGAEPSVHGGPARGHSAASTPGRRKFVPIVGEIPSPLAPPPGCHFHPRCPRALPRCREVAPALREIAPARWSACHLNDSPA